MTKPKLTLSGAIKRWRELRAQGIPAGAMIQEMALLRGYLLAIGQWKEIYRENR